MHCSRRLIVQTLVFSCSYLHRHVTPPETLVVKGELLGWEMAVEFCLKMPDFHVTFRDLLHAVNLRHGTNGFTCLPKAGVLRIFSPWKTRRLRPGLIWVPKANTLPLDHRSRRTRDTLPWYEPAISANERTQTHALNSAATGIGRFNYCGFLNCRCWVVGCTKPVRFLWRTNLYVLAALFSLTVSFMGTLLLYFAVRYLHWNKCWLFYMSLLLPVLHSPVCCLLVHIHFLNHVLCKTVSLAIRSCCWPISRSGCRYALTLELISSLSAQTRSNPISLPQL